MKETGGQNKKTDDDVEEMVKIFLSEEIRTGRETTTWLCELARNSWLHCLIHAGSQKEQKGEETENVGWNS